jgi:hypothetical protein
MANYILPKSSQVVDYFSNSGIAIRYFLKLLATW